MGLTYSILKIKQSRKADDFIEVRFLIDSGAVYSLVPETELAKLGIEAYKTMDFVLADGTQVTRNIGDAYFEYLGTGGAAPVIFGEAGDKALLGATTLEALGLVLNPFTRELKPMRMMLA